jgi:hypothetical protein
MFPLTARESNLINNDRIPAQPLKRSFVIRKAFSALSAFLMVDYTTYAMFPPVELDFLKFGETLNFHMTEITQGWHEINRLYPAEKYTLMKRKERLLLLEGQLTHRLTMTRILFDKLSAQPIIYDLVDYFASETQVNFDYQFRFKMTEQMIRWVRNNPELCGYAHEWYLVKCCDTSAYRDDKDDIYETQFRISNDIKVAKTITMDDLFLTAVATPHYLEKQLDAINHGEAIKFDFPVKIEPVEFGSDAELTLDWIRNWAASIENGETDLGKISKLKVRYRFSDVTFGGVTPIHPRWYGTVPHCGTMNTYPYHPEEDTRFDLSTLRHMVTAWKTGTFEVYDDFRWITYHYDDKGPIANGQRSTPT